MIGRLGEEEFAVILPDMSQAEAQEAVESFRASVSARALHLASRAEKLRCPAGIAQISRVGDVPSAIEDAISRADGALYQAKTSGRDRLVAA